MCFEVSHLQKKRYAVSAFNLVWAMMRENLTIACANKGTDQPAHPCSLINPFVICYMEKIVVKLAPCKVSIL